MRLSISAAYEKSNATTQDKETFSSTYTTNLWSHSDLSLLLIHCKWNGICRLVQKSVYSSPPKFFFDISFPKISIIYLPNYRELCILCLFFFMFFMINLVAGASLTMNLHFFHGGNLIFLRILFERVVADHKECIGFDD